MKNNIQSIREQLKNAKADETGMVELIDVNFICDENYILREPNLDYAKREMKWYDSMSLNVYDIPGGTPEIWKQVADKNGYINSNYGYLIYSIDNHSQYENAKQKLLKDKNTRQAMMIYTRPSIHKDAVTNGMSDFICTAYTHQFIRDNKLIYIVYQRSCDAVFGFNNDLYFHKEIYQRLLTELRGKYKNLQEEHIHYNVGSLHVYPRHQKLLGKI
jgi:thymidylate synthase